MPLLSLHRLRRVVMAAGAAAALLAALYSVALAHTRLVSSEPAIDARLTSSPRRIRLVFSEPVEPRLGGITVTGADSVGIRLAASGDPDDVHALIAPVEQPLPAGSYRVHWRAVSADGHPIEGSYAFTIASGAGRVDTAAAPVAAVVAATPPAPVTTEAPVPYGNAALRGLAVGCLMAACGLLLFVVFPGAAGASPPRVARVALRLTLAAALFTLLRLMAWAR